MTVNAANNAYSNMQTWQQNHVSRNQLMQQRDEILLQINNARANGHDEEWISDHFDALIIDWNSAYDSLGSDNPIYDATGLEEKLEENVREMNNNPRTNSKYNLDGSTAVDSNGWDVSSFDKDEAFLKLLHDEDIYVEHGVIDEQLDSTGKTETLIADDYDDYDTDKDGKISMDEYRQMIMTDLYSNLARGEISVKNTDGQDGLTFEEYCQAELDEVDSTKLTNADLDTLIGNTYALYYNMDDNKDGVVTEDELKAFYRQMDNYNDGTKNGYFNLDDMSAFVNGLVSESYEQLKGNTEEFNKGFEKCKSIYDMYATN